MIDWGRVKELQQEVGVEDFAEVIEIFFEEIERVVGRLPEIEEAKSLEHALHFLRSGSLNLGFRTLAKRCEAGEAQAECGAYTAVNIDAIANCYAASKAEFLNGMTQIAAA